MPGQSTMRGPGRDPPGDKQCPTGHTGLLACGQSSVAAESSGKQTRIETTGGLPQEDT